MVPLSILDLAPVVEGGDVRQALQNSLDLARHAEHLGYHRYWLAEHHGMPGIASAATSLVIAHVAQGTSRIRVGAGGIMLPNHSPLVIAEQFGTLEALFPGRIDLGVGRAPGTDGRTALALRRSLQSDEGEFPRDVVELMGYLGPAQPGQVLAVPGEGTHVPVYILGSSLFGAQLAAVLGLPYAFASHFAPAALDLALKIYREHYRPSERWPRPYAIAGFNVIAADTDDEARFLASSLEQAVVRLRTGKPGRLPPPARDLRWGEFERDLIDSFFTCSAVGSPATVKEKLTAFIERTGVDEVIVAGQVFDPAARIHSYELLAKVMELKPPNPSDDSDCARRPARSS
jgi:luciferase family oxidoreductase group 1